MSFEVRYSFAERAIHRLAFSTVGLQIELEGVELKLYGQQIENIGVERPVFVTALPRAGTTLVLELCASLDEFATHRYSDMPFVLLPLLWGRFSSRLRREAAPTERAHGDGMLISTDSPEAFEEILWKAMWPGHYRPDRIIPWMSEEHDAFAEYFSRHLRKIITLRRADGVAGMRYLSKNNANIARIPWLNRMFPDALILVPVREPIAHAASLLKQHRNFLEIHRSDGFAREYMRGIGHYDFGANLRPVDFNGWLGEAGARKAGSLSFWLEYWIHTYSHLGELQGKQVRILPYDDFCGEPSRGMRWLAEFLEIEERDAFVEQAERIRAPREHQGDCSGIDKHLKKKAMQLYDRLRSAVPW